MKPRKQTVLRGGNNADENAESRIELQRGGNEQEKYPSNGTPSIASAGSMELRRTRIAILTQLTSMKLFR